jgi:hypothetical protein
MFEIRKVTTPSKPLGAPLATFSMRDGCHGLVSLPPRGGEGKSPAASTTRPIDPIGGGGYGGVKAEVGGLGFHPRRHKSGAGGRLFSYTKHFVFVKDFRVIYLSISLI